MADFVTTVRVPRRARPGLGDGQSRRGPWRARALGAIVTGSPARGAERLPGRCAAAPRTPGRGHSRQLGLSLMSYVGHGGSAAWATEELAPSGLYHLFGDPAMRIR